MNGWLTGKVHTTSNFIAKEVILSMTSLADSQHN
jgi:hypothetical protein